eukprot:Pgem_evm1s10165
MYSLKNEVDNNVTNNMLYCAFHLFCHSKSLFGGNTELATWQTLLLGGFSGGIAPCCNSPLDVVKTRLQKQKIVPGEVPKYVGVVGCMKVMYREEGIRSFYK